MRLGAPLAPIVRRTGLACDTRATLAGKAGESDGMRDDRSTMIAFLKRRWILLSCAVVLMACTMVDVFWALPRDMFFLRRFGGELSASGIRLGSIGCVFRHSPQFSTLLSAEGVSRKQLSDKTVFHTALHAPVFGGKPRFTSTSNRTSAVIPLWLPLSAVLGWLVIRELRWREKRSKEASAIE